MEASPPKSSQHESKSKSTLPWVEEFRPKQFSEIVLTPRDSNPACSLLNRLEHWGAHSCERMPHLLFEGPPGTGKTTTIGCLIRHIYQDVTNDPSEYIFELNASKDRGIETMRTAVKQFASRANSSGKPGLVILDEADYLTPAAQDALRLQMEEHMKQTRFVLICNRLHSIRSALRSRCTIIRFPPVNRSLLLKRLRWIADQKHQKVAPAAFNAIADECAGDLRRAVSLFQASVVACSVDDDKECLLKSEHVRLVLGQPTDKELENVFVSLNSGSFERLQRAAREYIRMGWSVLTLLLACQQQVMYSIDLSDLQKAIIALALADANLHIIEGADEYLELLQLMSRVSESLK